MEYKKGSKTFTLKLIKAEHLKNVDEADSSDLSKSTFVIVQCILALLLYMVLGIFGFKVVEPEWTYIDTFYFSVITMATIGYGDLKPSSVQSKIFSVAYGLIGIAYIGAAMGILGGALMESVSAKMATTPKVGAGDVDPEEHTEKVLEETERGKDPCCSQQFLARSRTVGTWTLVMMVNIVGGGVFLAWLEGQDIGDMIYLGFVTLTTIGYGDFYPVSQGGRLFTAFWAMIGTVIVANMLSILAGFIVEDQHSTIYTTSQFQCPYLTARKCRYCNG
jgi:potassium channel subfamily K, other eukaryote